MEVILVCFQVTFPKNRNAASRDADSETSGSCLLQCGGRYLARRALATRTPEDLLRREFLAVRAGEPGARYYTILYYTIYYTILYYTILYYTILYYTILYYTILYYYPIFGVPGPICTAAVGTTDVQSCVLFNQWETGGEGGKSRGLETLQKKEMSLKDLTRYFC